MNNLYQNYKIILAQLHKLDISFEPFVQIRKPKLSNMECIALNLTAEYMSIDSECQLFRTLKGTPLDGLIERSVYNKRKRMLVGLLNKVRLNLSRRLNEAEQYYIVDSMPLDICKLSRSKRSVICKEEEHTFPDKGYCASQDRYFYGYKMHAVVSCTGVVEHFDLTAASVHDVHYLNDIKYQMKHCTIIGDKGYISATQQTSLFESANIRLEVPMRSNQHNFRPQPYIIRKTRKRIETFFSQLCDQFMIRRNYAKTFEGFRIRILSKVTTATMIQFLNKFLFNRNINNLKVNLT